MTQSDLNRAVARATGESVSEIARLGFVPLTGGGFEPESPDPPLDWDAIQALRACACSPRRRRPAVRL